jgi:excisionase family DNA binding protein
MDRFWNSGAVTMFTAAVAVSIEHKFLLSRDEAAQCLDICTKTLDKLVVTGELRARRIGGRILFSRTELQRFSEATTDTSKG